MSDRAPLRRSLRAGAVYDVALGIFVLTVAPLTFEALGFARPDSPFLFRLAALPLFILPVLYWTAAGSGAIDAFRAPVLWARGCGGGLILVGVAAMRPEGAVIYAVVGALDLVWAAVHAALWRNRSEA